MKRKSGSRKSTKAEENGTGAVQENGGEDASQDKKNKRSRRSKSKNESEVSAEDSEADSKVSFLIGFSLDNPYKFIFVGHKKFCLSTILIVVY